MRSGLTSVILSFWKGPVRGSEHKSQLSSASPGPPLCDLSLPFTALCRLDLELQVFTLFQEEGWCLVPVGIIVYTFSSASV